MTGDETPPDVQPPEPPPQAPTHVGPSRGVVITLGVLIVVFVFGAAAIIGYLVLGRSDSGGSFPTAAPGATSVTVTAQAESASPTTSSVPTTPRSSSSARRSTPVTTAAGAPEGSRPCPILSGPTGLYRASSVGSSVTSCGFAEQVRLAYAASGRPGQLPRTITATSPETGERIQMMCAAQGQRVTCNGGDDALVYLY